MATTPPFPEVCTERDLEGRELEYIQFAAQVVNTGDHQLKLRDVAAICTGLNVLCCMADQAALRQSPSPARKFCWDHVQVAGELAVAIHRTLLARGDAADAGVVLDVDSPLTDLAAQAHQVLERAAFFFNRSQGGGHA